MRLPLSILLAAALSSGIGCAAEPAPVLRPRPEHPARVRVGVSSASARWTVAGVMHHARTYHTATVLPSGLVLAAGGAYDGSPTAELYDETTSTWTLTAGTMNAVRAQHAATLLPSGLVLVTGGAWTTNRAELYDPAQDAWTPVAAMGYETSHTATLLPSGLVLVAGGQSDGVDQSAAKLYDPAGDAWSPAASMHQTRAGHTATLLADGRVLVTGGIPNNLSADVSQTVEAYDPGGDAWTLLAPLDTDLGGHTATLLPGGQVLVAGGLDIVGASSTTVASTYDPLTDTWTDAASMLVARAYHTATPLADGRVLVAGGSDSALAEIYDPAGDQWLPAGTLSQPRASAAAGRLLDGHVLIAGGNAGADEAFATTELLAGFPGDPCTSASDCLTVACSGGLCCDSACDAPCQACSRAAGATADGTCTPLSGVACDDHDPCTQTDTCQSGVCVGGDPVVCSAPDACHDAVCQPSTGACAILVRSGATCAADAGSADAGSADAGSGENLGAPLPPPAAALGATLCHADADCGSGDAGDAGGHCVDGVCCDTACLDACHSCALVGSLGVCTIEPSGVDLRHDCGPTANCLSTCGGAGTCIGAGPGTQCQPAECAADGVHGAGPALCPSQGAECPSERVPFTCAPYRCITALGACSAACVSVNDCAAPYFCDPTHRCVAAPDVSSGSECAAAPGASGSAAGGLALALMAVAAAAWRRGRGRAWGAGAPNAGSTTELG